MGVFKRFIKSHRGFYLSLRELIMRYRKFRYGWGGVSITTWMVARQKYISRDFSIGDYGFVGRDCTIYPKVSAGRFVLIAPEVSILGGDHEYKMVGVPICFSGREFIPPTTIGDDVWIGMSAKLIAGVTIGSGAIVAAGAVVTHDVPPFAIVAGVPAKIIRYRFEREDDRASHLKALSKIRSYGELVTDLN
ncbi:MULTISPECIES: CatB-related O-acetyltransferase [Pseudomonas]|nr:CatB-related O-acetyltransferase [Pseudomonas canavaninivorans]UVM70938.1 CatB-related O-acetyltransferase [Pseudomonas canavaninivorans]